MNVIAVSYPTVDSIVTWSSSSNIVMNQSSYFDQNTFSFRSCHARNPGRLDSGKNEIGKLKVWARSLTVGYKVSPLSNQGHPQLICFSTSKRNGHNRLILEADRFTLSHISVAHGKVLKCGANSS